MDCAKLNRASSLPPKKRIKATGNDIKPRPVFKRSLSLTLPARSPVLMLSRKLCQSQDSPNIRSWKLSGGLVEEEGEQSTPGGIQLEVQYVPKSAISKSKDIENEQNATGAADPKEGTSCVHKSYYCCCGTVRKSADQMDESTQTENSPCRHIPIPPPPPPLPMHFNAPVKIVLKDQSTASSVHSLASDKEDSGNVKSEIEERELKDITENAETTLEQNAVRYIDEADGLEWASLFHEDEFLRYLDLDSNADSYETMRCVICYQCVLVSKSVSIPPKPNGIVTLPQNLQRISRSNIMFTDDDGRLWRYSLESNLVSNVRLPGLPNGCNVYSICNKSKTNQGLLAVCTDGHTINLYSSVGIMDNPSKGTIVYPRPFKILFSTVSINAMVFSRDDTLALASTSNRTLTIWTGILQSA
eukprot:Seg2005.2 transcript_id=Seg2005.2/GoldUCD/mRNA.D3Y31 product="hypothetical protein" protein_id=Seg2005.2/GoldUCD/D3Y31